MVDGLTWNLASCRKLGCSELMSAVVRRSGGRKIDKDVLLITLWSLDYSTPCVMGHRTIDCPLSGCSRCEICSSLLPYLE